MARDRLLLHNILKEILGSNHVYFQPPSNLAMEYPAIVYERDAGDTKHANNLPYSYDKRYQLTVMDFSPDSEIPDKIAQLPMCTHDREFVSGRLNHDVFTIYF